MLIFAGVVALGFRRKALTLSGIGLGALVLAVSLISALSLVRALWGMLAKSPTYQVTYLGHTVNESLLMTLFGSVTLALTITWYALIQKIRPTSAPDLMIGAFVLLTVATVGFAFTMPEGSYLAAWTVLCSLFAVGYWFYSMRDDRESFSTGQLAALILAAFVVIALMLPVYIADFMASAVNDWSLSIIIMVLLSGMLVSQLHIITRPNKWWLPVAAWIAAAVSLVAVLVG